MVVFILLQTGIWLGFERTGIKFKSVPFIVTGGFSPSTIISSSSEISLINISPRSRIDWPLTLNEIQ